MPFPPNGCGCFCNSAGGVSALLLTLSDCINTTDETVVASATVPANSWNDGEEIIFEFTASLHVGPDIGEIAVPLVYVGGVAYDITGGAGLYPQQGVDGLTKFKLRFLRVGADVWYQDANNEFSNWLQFLTGQNTATVNNEWSGFQIQDRQHSDVMVFPVDNTVVPAGNVFTPDFTTNIDLQVSITYDQADPDEAFRTINGACYKMPALFIHT